MEENLNASGLICLLQLSDGPGRNTEHYLKTKIPNMPLRRSFWKMNPADYKDFAPNGAGEYSRPIFDHSLARASQAPRSYFSVTL